MDDKESMIIDIDLPEWPAENPFEKYCMVRLQTKKFGMISKVVIYVLLLIR